jgi:TP53 regulating kinase-like protein
MIGTQFETQNGTYTITCLLGKGKSGHTYLMERQTAQGMEERVLKIMHDEVVPFYSFRRDRVEAEVDAYRTLRPHGIHMPELLEYDIDRRYLVKSYVDGPTAAALVADSLMDDAILVQLFEMASRLEAAGINIDYFPTNFVVTPAGELSYIDYEINPYTDAWNLANWGIYYWVNQQGMCRFLQTGDASYINQDLTSGIPIKEGLEAEVARLYAAFAVP